MRIDQKIFMISSFNKLTSHPTVFAMDGDLSKGHNYYFYKNGFTDGVEYSQNLLEKVGKTSSRDVEALRSAISVKDVRLMLMEQDNKRLMRLIERRNNTLTQIHNDLKVMNEIENPEKVSILYAINTFKRYDDDLFKSFHKEIL